MNIIKGKIAKLRPTQICIGYDEVELKMAELKSLSSKKLEAYLETHPIPCVIGPGDHLYLIDHHHMGLALTKLGHHECFIDVVHDLSTIPESKFFGVMAVLELLYPHGPSGELLPICRVPKHLVELLDDPYRSLAGFVRKHNGFVKVGVPYFEFQWANFFRQRLDPLDLEGALILASSGEAKNLPGYLGIIE